MSEVKENNTNEKHNLAVKLGFPTDEGCHSMANLLKDCLSNDDVKQMYSEWGDTGTYDKSMSNNVYKGPYLVSKAVNDNIPNKNAKILDIACGTGFVGEHLKKFGFTNVDGMDAARGMLENAEKKSAYQNYICSVIGEGSVHGIPDRTYDVITISGGFGPGHITLEAIPEMIELVKPGGFIFNITRKNHLNSFEEYKDKWEPYIQSLEDAGKWREISRTIFRNYYFEKDGIMFIHEVL
ncbi:methyltransferase-like protein 27 [Octopus sinensis]|uniref:Methyltransferase-like protein 27 n=1 Tax=Octopus sinensis TaxID=2607531 RepID=A0A6P7T2Q9_9MOLL|nr:methyltransferase-like protein 27 [Octopus sinensis]